MNDKLTRKQISDLRGKLKSPQRNIAMRRRYESYRSKVVREYQEKLAKEILLHI